MLLRVTTKIFLTFILSILICPHLLNCLENIFHSNCLHTAVVLTVKLITGCWTAHIFQHEYERITASTRRALGEEAFENAFAKGREMTLEQAIAYALEGS